MGIVAGESNHHSNISSSGHCSGAGSGSTTATASLSLYATLPELKGTFPCWRKKNWGQIRGLGERLGPTGCQLLEGLLEYNPQRRTGAKHALRHAFFHHT